MLTLGKPDTAAQLQEYFELRWRVLRAPWDQPRGSERDALDSCADHVTARDQDGRLLGIGRLHRNDASEVQIRYMVTVEDSRGCGVGRAIVTELEQLARAHAAARIVLYARDQVVGFYRRLGYRATGSGPTLFGRIKHLKMEKKL